MNLPQPAFVMNQRVEYCAETWWVYGIHLSTNRYTYDNNEQVWTIAYDLSSKPAGTPYDQYSPERFRANIHEPAIIAAY